MVQERGARFSIRSLSEPVRLSRPLELAAGECIAFSGPSGSGKSRFLRALADLDPNDAEVQLDGQSRRDFAAPAWRQRVTYLAAESGWWASCVEHHFADENLAAAKVLLPELALPAAALSWEVARLSTGERQRLALIRALVQVPDVLLLDEPTASLDGKATGHVESLLRAEMERGAVIFLVTHDPAQADRLASRHCTVADLTIGEAAS